MKLALFQMKNEGSVKANLKKSLLAIEKAAKNGADLIFFPEIQLTEFFPQFRKDCRVKPANDTNYKPYNDTNCKPCDVSERNSVDNDKNLQESAKSAEKNPISLDSSIIKAFCDAAKKNNIMVSPNVYLCENKKNYDASILINKSGKILGTQKMVHIAGTPQFYEQDYYEPSNNGFNVFETEIGKIGIVVCFDRHYPESIRTESLRGADLILIPTANTKAEPSEMFKWEICVQAFQNSVCVAMCNRVGTESEMQFSGESIVVDENGSVIKLADDKEQILYAELDLNQVQKTRHEKPYTTLRRKEFYE